MKLKNNRTNCCKCFEWRLNKFALDKSELKVYSNGYLLSGKWHATVTSSKGARAAQILAISVNVEVDAGR